MTHATPDNWFSEVQRYQRDGMWNYTYGEPPGHPDTRVPPDVRERFKIKTDLGMAQPRKTNGANGHVAAEAPPAQPNGDAAEQHFDDELPIADPAAARIVHDTIKAIRAGTVDKLKAISAAARQLDPITQGDALDFLSNAAIDDLGMDPDAVQFALQHGQQDREAGRLGEDRARSGDTPKRGKFEPIPLKVIKIDDGPVCLIDGLLPMGPAFGLTVGAPKSLKSFLLMRAGLSIAASLPFASRNVKQSAVVYITSEGIRGVKRRLVAMRKALSLEGRDVPFFLVPAMPNLGTGVNDLNLLISEIEKVVAGCGYSLAMVVIDTLRRATPGKDENSAKDMGDYVKNCDAIATKFLCLVMSAHHSPRSADGRGSGSNALDGALDVMWAVIRDGNSLTATATIAWFKDGDGEGTSWTFTLRTDIEIGRNRQNEPIFGCAVDITTDANEPGSTNRADKNKKQPWERGSLPTFKLALIHVLDSHGTMRRPYPDGPEVRAVDATLARTEFLKRYAADTQEAKGTAWRRSLKDATQTYHLVGTREVEGAQLLWFARDEMPSS
jgi:hypothetical protein